MLENKVGRASGRVRARWAVVAVTLVLLSLAQPAGQAGAAPSAGTSQVVTVETASASATTGVLRAWERAGGGWRLAAGPYSVFVGQGGVGSAREGSTVTPAGTYPLTEAFGRLPNPGTAMPYFQSTRSDWWDSNTSSSTYNTHVRRTTSPGAGSENLYDTGAAYDYAVNIGYNLARVPGAGSAFFLHVSNGRPTAGCVSMDRDALAGILRWLRPEAQPQIVIGTAPVWAGTQDGAVGGVGGSYFLNDRFDGAANHVFPYGDPGDEVYVGDWDGNGTDTLAVRRGNVFYLKNDTRTGVADVVATYGDPGDTVLVGDWDGNATDTLLIRRGATYFVRNTVTTGTAERTFVYGDPGDSVLVGRWTTTGAADSLAVRRGNVFFLKNTTASGQADVVFAYGDVGDTAFTGDWDGDGVDGLGVRRR